ncbi:8046_t:CDS:2 [Diversispora eburnea]|uniref:8046_t:CDS:1 n=1 Tax=Diversispora eburnea TaxID=1213867 RepID=A0A9N9BVD0_9GLOM|nr:8046_t:CDS:2 [Diversispora eburnea]
MSEELNEVGEENPIEIIDNALELNGTNDDPIELIGNNNFSISGEENNQSFISQKRKNRKEKRRYKNGKRFNSGKDMSETTTFVQSVNTKVVKKPPNYFLSIRIDYKVIQENLAEFTNYVEKNFPEYKKLLIKPKQCHITLFVLRLDEDNIDQAKECLSTNSRSKLSEGWSIATFERNSPDLDSFTKLTYALHDKFKKNGLVDNDIHKEFKPHVTLMRLRYPIKIKSKDQKCDFGKHFINTIELSSMLMPKDDDGYYAKIEAMTF